MKFPHIYLPKIVASPLFKEIKCKIVFDSHWNVWQIMFSDVHKLNSSPYDQFKQDPNLHTYIEHNTNHNVL